MTILLDCQNLEKSFGTKSLFTDLTFGVFEGDRLGLVGRNGSGKSTLLKIVAGMTEPDAGEVVARSGLRVAYIAQVDNFNGDQSVEDVLRQYSSHANLPADALDQAVFKTLSKHGFKNPGQKVEDLSGGWRKRLAIAAALVNPPDLLLLDEPTNHLDLESVFWLESLLKRARFSWILVSHDRCFLENTTNKVAEIAPSYPNGIFFSEGAYERFLSGRREYFMQLRSQAESLANKMRVENAWLQRGPKARTTKAKARIERAADLVSELSGVKAQLKKEEHVFDFSSSGRRTKRLAELEEVTFSYDSDRVFGPWNILLPKGVRLGLLGRNGTGKSTLMKLVTKDLEPATGVVHHTESLSCVYFDQKREALDEGRTLKYALAENGQQVIFRGKPMHVVSWAKKFMFEANQLDTPVGKLSGGEKAKVILARLMRQPADLLALDEPTNDLDIDALETLEESLLSFPGAVLVISHDRYFMETVCTHFLGFDQQGRLSKFQDYEQWETVFRASLNPQKTTGKLVTKSAGDSKSTVSRQPHKEKIQKRLSYMEQREFDSMEEKIANLEAELNEAKNHLNSSEIAVNATALTEAARRCDLLQESLDKLYERWAELEAKMS